MSDRKVKRTFSPQCRAEAVQLVVSSGRPIAHVAKELDVTDQTLGVWVKAWRDENEIRPGPDLSPVQAAELTAALTENTRLRMENESRS